MNYASIKLGDKKENKSHLRKLSYAPTTTHHTIPVCICFPALPPPSCCYGHLCFYLWSSSLLMDSIPTFLAYWRLVLWNYPVSIPLSSIFAFHLVQSNQHADMLWHHIVLKNCIWYSTHVFIPVCDVLSVCCSESMKSKTWFQFWSAIY